MANRRRALPRAVTGAAHAVTGVALGTYLRESSLATLVGNWAVIAAVIVFTVAISFLAGVALARWTRLDPATGTLGMIAGGAVGVLAMAKELGADARFVAFMQYFRVLVVVSLMPVILTLLGGAPDGGDSGAAGESGHPFLGAPRDWALTALMGGSGAYVGERLGIPAGRLLGAMLLTAVSFPLLPDAFDVPPAAQYACFAAIGLGIGLRFTRRVAREIAALFPQVTTVVLAMMVACLGLAWAMTAVAGVSLRDAYLATTPGGLYAVAAAAIESQANAALIVAMQSLRLFVMVLISPLAVRWAVALAGSGRLGSGGRV